MENNQFLDFELPIRELESKIQELEHFSSVKSLDLSSEINALKKKLDTVTNKIFSNLTSIQRVDLARHPKRPLVSDYLQTVFQDFMELKGDRLYGNDEAVITGLAMLGKHHVMIIGHKRGATTEERLSCNFGMPKPEGYRKALAKMKLAEKFNIPIITMINTPGAYPGIGSEERGQAMAIAQNLFSMSQLKTRIISLIIGEGGSGGAVGIGVADRMLIMENAFYSVISPEGCAAILWRSAEKRQEAAKALRIIATDLKEQGVVDEIIPEPPGGAHRNYEQTSRSIKTTLIRILDELQAKPMNELLEARYAKFRNLGLVIE